MIAMIMLAIVTLGIYLVCWLLSKKHNAWMVTALVLFSIDSIIMLIFYFGFSSKFDIYSIVDIAFHAYVLYYLFMGTSAGIKIKKLPPEQPVVVEVAPVIETKADEDNLFNDKGNE